MILSGRSMVLATASTTNLACCLVGQSNRLYRTVCLRVHRRSSSSANSTVVTLFFWLPEGELLKYFSKSVEAWFAVALSPVSCYKDVTKLLSNYQCTSLIRTLLYISIMSGCLALGSCDRYHATALYQSATSVTLG